MKTGICLFLLFAGFSNAAVINVPGDVPSISWAVDIAESSDEIIIANSTYFEWGIAINGKTLTLTGPSGASSSVVIDALHQDRIMSLNNASVTLKGITFRNGLSTGVGGAVHITGTGQHTFLGCSFVNNMSDTWGGAIFCNGASCAITLQDAILTGNIAEDGGGGLYIYSGAHMYLIDCHLSDNKAALGGGIYVDNSSLWSNRNIWEDNIAYISGGAIYSNNGIIEIHDSSIYNNMGSNGAGYYLNGTTNMYVNFTDLNDESYYCPNGTYVAFVCCSYPEWICGDLFYEDDCLPISADVLSWGEVKQLFR